MTAELERLLLYRTPPPRLGFGCADLLKSRDKRAAARLLETAFENGIRHFDVGRAYGDGRAEHLVGALAIATRNDIRIVTKAGIDPPSAWRRLGRTLLGAEAPQRFRRFAPEQVAMSILRSLRAMDVQQIDTLLLHECAAKDLTDDLYEMVSRIQRDGFIREFGIATSVAHSKAILRQRPEFCAVVQIADNGQEDLPSFEGELITHSIFASQGTADAREVLVRSLSRNPQGTVIFSSRTPAHIATNANIWREHFGG